MPHPDCPDVELPAPDDQPSVAENKSWTDLEDVIVPSLKKFYNHRFRHPIHIPSEDRREMLKFFENGPPKAPPPRWINWAQHPLPQDESSVVEEAASCVSIDRDVNSNIVEVPYGDPF